MLGSGPSRAARLDPVDAVLAAVLVVITGIVGTDYARTAAFTGPAWLGWLVAIALCAPVAVRWRWPVAVLAVVSGALLAATLFGIVRGSGGPAFLVAPALALYAVGRAEPARRAADAVLAVIVAAGIAALAVVVAFPGTTAFDHLGVAGIIVVELSVAWLAGRAVRAWRARAADAARLRTERAIADERLRIARELHDVVAHSLSLIAVRAGAANHVAETRPEQAREALRVIEIASRDTLGEMRRLLGVLRAAPAAGADPADPDVFDPAPGLADLPALASGVDLEIELDVRTEPGVPGGVQLSAYRIVQEALTNVVRHAGRAPCRVCVVADGGEVLVEVADEGPGPRPGWDDPGRGHGLIGMRERAAVYGGTFTAGAGPSGGFTITVRLPYGRGS